MSTGTDSVLRTSWQLVLEVEGERFAVRADRPLHLAIPLDFRGTQPGAFGLPPARSEVCQVGEFVGDTRQRGSCNCETVTLTPHGNGTHTEGIGHLTEQRIAVHAALREALVPATLITVTPEAVGDGATAVTAGVLARANLEPGPFTRALIIRTRPNEWSKKSRDWSGSKPPYFTPEAIRNLRGLGTTHLVCDLPSLDPERDSGALAAHRAFWEIQGSEVNAITRNRTVTELAFVDDTIADGRYLLNLQIAPFVLDAAPSRPVLFEVNPL